MFVVVINLVSDVFCVTVVQSQNDYAVTYTSTQICAVKGSTVDISCSFKHPSRVNVLKRVWFTKGNNYNPEDLKTDPVYAGRVSYSSDWKSCTIMTIRDLREKSDSAEYHFKFKTQRFEWKNAPKFASVLVLNNSHEIMEGSSVNLICSSDANPAANYTWYKDKKPISTEQDLIFRSIQSSDSGEYNCTAKNELGQRPSEVISINVKYAPKLPSVSVSPSAEIVEGSSVTLTCSSDANPAENKLLLHGPVGRYHLSSISSEHNGNYSCKAENLYGPAQSVTLYIDVEYPPRLPSVLVSPSAEIVEGSSVTLTCSSDANPAASYTWYKEDEDSAKASGQNFTITDFRPEHIGSYYCVAQNTRGHHNSTLQLIVTASK
uniref:Ig-like domain-containing protein n=1 Tax=Pundamilia nyererei TaxID=303518 RepID=A0A3B4H570_9CICH